jgi:S-ribosylhomocysteine lyase LuxS involved in autoinducer biosynthesis
MRFDRRGMMVINQQQLVRRLVHGIEHRLATLVGATKDCEQSRVDAIFYSQCAEELGDTVLIVRAIDDDSPERVVNFSYRHGQ